MFRFRRAIAAHKTAKLSIVQEHVYGTGLEVLTLATKDLTPYLKDSAIPQKVRDALAKAVVMKEGVATLKARGTELSQQMNALSTDQGRIRDNLKSVSPESDYSKRLMKKIDDEESSLEKAQATIADVQQKEAAAQQQLNDYLTGLTVEISDDGVKP